MAKVGSILVNVWKDKQKLHQLTKWKPKKSQPSRHHKQLREHSQSQLEHQRRLMDLVILRKGKETFPMLIYLLHSSLDFLSLITFDWLVVWWITLINCGVIGFDYKRVLNYI